MSRVPVLFDANGVFGKASTGGSEFPTIRARLDHMDRLGITRSLVWNEESRQDHALSSNQRLIDEIARTPGARGRVIPSLTVSGLMTYERDGIQALARQMKAGATRALRFVTRVPGRLTLCQLEPVIRAIQPLRPFILLRHDEAGVPDILEFSAVFPDVPLILTDYAWGPCITVYDLMRRRKSILADNSWHHTCSGLELAVKQFGAGRLVFGTGPRSHNGAAIAALARADITDAERNRVAHGNLDRLLGIRAAAASRPVAGTHRNRLWMRLLDGQPLGVDVIDCHGHLGPSAGYVLEAQDEREQVALGLKQMDAIGIRTMLVSGLQALMGGPVEGNDLLEQLLRPHRGRFAGYVAFNPFYADELIPRLDGYFSGPVFIGFKTLCDYWQVPATDARFKPMWEYASRYRLPVLAHTWAGSFDSPRMFDDIARRYPRVPILLGHSGGGDAGRREAEEVACKRRNVYLEWCGSFCSTIRWEETLKRVPVEQVLFGTDAMVHGIDWELGRLLSVDVPDRVLTPILGANMRRILAARRRP